MFGFPARVYVSGLQMVKKQFLLLVYMLSTANGKTNAETRPNLRNPSHSETLRCLEPVNLFFFSALSWISASPTPDFKSREGVGAISASEGPTSRRHRRSVCQLWEITSARKMERIQGKIQEQNSK